MIPICKCSDYFCVYFCNQGDIATVASRQQSIDADLNKDKESAEDTAIQNGRLSVFVHKRDDQFSHEVIQPLLR